MHPGAVVRVIDGWVGVHMEHFKDDIERKYRDLVESTDTGFVILHQDGTVMDANDRYVRMTGYVSLVEILGRSVVEWTSPRDREKNESAVTQCMRDGQVRGLEIEYLSPDGTVTAVEINATTFGQGGDLRILSLCRDITERKRVEAALLESERRSRSLVAAIPDLMFVVSKDGTYLDFMADHRDRLFIPSTELIGRNIRDTGFSPEQADAIMDHIARVLETRVMAEFEYTMEIQGRKEYWSARMVAMDDDKVLALCRDVTERTRAEEALRASEERYRALYRDNPSMFFTLDERGTVISVNDFGARELGYSIRELEGEPVLKVFHEADRAEVARKLEACLENPGTSYRWEFRKVRKDGAVIWVDEVARAMLDSGGRPIVLVVCTDITEQKRAQEEKQRLEDELRQAQKIESIGRLTGGIAHDFNNLLTAILGNASLALMDLNPDESLYATISEIHKAARSAASLTNQLLAFSRKQIIEPQVIEINAAMGEMQRMLERIIGENIALTTGLGEGAGAVRIDPGQFEQIVVNLVVNARDAMANGGRVRIETAAVELDEALCRLHEDVRPGPYVRLVVSDTGSGMSQEVQEHLFEPFFTTKSRGKGTGLGLATVYGSVRQNHGFVEIHSREGEGTTVKVYLPRAQSDAGVSPAARMAAEPRGGRETLILVEDEPQVRELTIRLLERFGYRVIHYPDAESALRDLIP